MDGTQLLTDPTSWPKPDELDDQGRVLAGLISPAPAHSLVMPPPDSPPPTVASQSTPQTGNLAAAPQQAVAKNQDTLQPGVPLAAQQQRMQAYSASGGPQRLAASLSPASTDPANPDPNASLRSGGSGMGLMPATPTFQAQQVQAPSQLDTDQARLSALQKQAANHHHGAWDAIGNIFVPGAMAAFNNTSLGEQRRIGLQQGLVNNDQAQLQQAAQLADTQSQQAEREAKAKMEMPITLSDEQSKAGFGDTSMSGQQVPQRVFQAAVSQNLRNQGNLAKQDSVNEANAAYRGEKKVTGPDGKATYIPDETSPMYAWKQSQTALNQAKAELAAAGNDQSSPQYKLALFKAQTAASNAGAANVRARAYWGNYLQGAYNKGLDGSMLPGTPEISDESGNLTGVGTKNAAQAVKAQGNVAQFNDVYAALDSLDNSAKALVQKGGKLNDPIIAAGLAQPKDTLSQWVQGQVANGNMTPEQRDYVVANHSAHERIQGMRKSAGGTSTDTSVAKLDALIPGASTPDLDYFQRQTDQIRNTANVLGTGVTQASGGSKLRPAGGHTPPHAAIPAGNVKVQLANGRTGHISSAQQAQFLKDNPGSSVVK